MTDHPSLMRRELGLSLIEVMVAMAVGLITVLVVMQVLLAFEGDKRTTTGAADAQTNGGIALYNIRRQVQMAGFGLPVFTANTAFACGDTTLAIGGANIFPIEIVDGGNAAGASDTIRVRYGSSPLGGVPVKALTLTNPLGVSSSMACQAGDSVLLVNGAICSATSVAAVPDDTHVTLNSVAGIVANKTSIACVGQWRQFAYTVNNERLELATTVANVTTTTPVVADIVNIQAQYGVSGGPTTNIITSWVDATGGTWANPSLVNRNRIKAVRVAIVARSGLREKDIVSTACSSLIAAAPTGLCAWEGVPAGGTITTASPAPAINLDVTGDGEWQHYRYRVYETIIPLRNVIWSRKSLG
jgi:type IV pilus assembly protein PilW